MNESPAIVLNQDQELPMGSLSSGIFNNKAIIIFLFQKDHKCVLDSCRALEGEGFDVTYLQVMANGLIDLQVGLRVG